MFLRSLILASCVIVSGFAQTVTSTSWSKIAPPVSGLSNSQSLYAAGDGYLYLATHEGMWRATEASVIATPAVPSIWSRIQTGLVPDPTTPGHLMPVQRMATAPDGSVWALTGGKNASGVVMCCYASKLNQTTKVWTTHTVYSRVSGFDHPTFLVWDTTGAMYYGTYFTAEVFKSTDGGVTWTNLTPGGIWNTLQNSSCYTGGFVSAIFHNGVLEIGGESPTFQITTGITHFHTIQDSMLSACGSTNWHRNLGKHIVTDGTATTPGTETLYIGKVDVVSGSPIYRCDGTSTQCSVINNYSNSGSPWLGTVIDVAQGPALHEYWFTTGTYAASSHVYHSTDGGLSWTYAPSEVGLTLGTSSTNLMSISRSTGHKYLSTGPALGLWVRK